ncbi:MAG TPA: bifunctional nuclease family protein [Anaerolineae bacterium]|nr:bifunctional nuclease family protein [Anaerolineae bacterium]
MIEVAIDSIRVSLMTQQRVVILKDLESDRYLPIWIGPCEAESITIELQGVAVARPLTHDLLKTVVINLGGKVSQVVVNDLRNDTFYARILLSVNGRQMEIDARPSDAIALAVRARVPIYVAEAVMEAASIVPEEDMDAERADTDARLSQSPFGDLIDNLDLDDLGPEDK